MGDIRVGDIRVGEIRFRIGDVRDGETRVGGLRPADGRISDSIFESRRRVERFSESNELWCGRYSTPGTRLQTQLCGRDKALAVR